MKQITKLSRTFLYFSAIAVIGFMILTLIFPNEIKSGALSGLIISGNVLIPTLFPFTVCVLFIMRCRIPLFPEKAEKITMKLFGMNSSVFTCFILSFIGGYPVGARLLNELYESKKLSRGDSALYLNCFVNAGPAFTVSAVGSGMFGSQKLGFILLAAHISASIISALILGGFTDSKKCSARMKEKRLPIADIFVSSTADAAQTVLNICAFVILFSAINSAIYAASAKFPVLAIITYFTEVTAACSKTGNIYFVSFLLGFSGFCIWCQIFSAAKDIKKNIFVFALGRIFHGAVSAALTYILLKIFPCSIQTVSNGINGRFKTTYSGVSLSLALALMVILLIISMQRKNHSGKLLEDVI